MVRVEVRLNITPDFPSHFEFAPHFPLMCNQWWPNHGILIFLYLLDHPPAGVFTVVPVDCFWLQNKCLANVHGEEQFANVFYPFVGSFVPKAQGQFAYLMLHPSVPGASLLQHQLGLAPWCDTQDYQNRHVLMKY